MKRDASGWSLIFMAFQACSNRVWIDNWFKEDQFNSLSICFILILSEIPFPVKVRSNLLYTTFKSFISVGWGSEFVCLIGQNRFRQY